MNLRGLVKSCKLIVVQNTNEVTLIVSVTQVPIGMPPRQSPTHSKDSRIRKVILDIMYSRRTQR